MKRYLSENWVYGAVFLILLAALFWPGGNRQTAEELEDARMYAKAVKYLAERKREEQLTVDIAIYEARMRTWREYNSDEDNTFVK